MTARRLAAATLLLLATALLTPGCGDRSAPTRPAILIGIDGAEWSVIRQLWAEGRLPHLERLAETGTTAELRTDYGESPVIWTTVATGMKPAGHGITGFVVSTEEGDVPVSTALRRVPALWNMATASGRRSAVLAWWPSWPAEEIDGIMISDRALLDIEERVWPHDWQPRLEELIRRSESGGERYGGANAAARDRLVATAGAELASQDFDLLMAYFKSVDETCHHYWKHFRPQRFTDVDEKEVEAEAWRVRDAYEAVDRALGGILAAAGPEVNVFVVSDHGFHAASREKVRVSLDLDRVLAAAGLLAFSADGGVDLGRSEVFTYASPPFRRIKRLRFALAGRDAAGRVEPAQIPAIRKRLERALAGVAYSTGEPVLFLRDPTPKESQEGADLIVEVRSLGASRELLLAGDPIRGAVRRIERISGTHGPKTEGIFLAAGPDIDPQAEAAGISIHDIAPTLLFALGLPVAEDFDGRAWTELFSADFRRDQPLRSIASWGVNEAGEASASEADEDLVEELRALGYLD